MATEQRLIDANKYHEVLSRSLDMTIGIEDSKTASVMAGTIIACQCLLDEQPTIEARPVVHGEWIHVPSSDMMTGKAYKCSECGKMRYGSFKPNYCGNCGAQMDGRRTE